MRSGARGWWDDVHVFRSGPKGRWVVATRCYTRHPYRTQEAAVRAGKREAVLHRVELVIHNRGGRIRSKDSDGNESPRLDMEH